MKKALRVIFAVLAVLLLFSSVPLAILYQKGYYDFTFIRRPETTAKEPDKTAQIPRATENVRDPQDPATPVPVTGSYSSENAKLCTVSEFPSWVLTEAVYKDGETLLLRLDGKTDLPSVYSTSKWEVRTPVRTDDGENGTSTVILITEEKKPAARLYMGTIITDDKGVEGLVGPDGRLISSRIDPGLKPAGLRTNDGAPVWRYRDSLFKYAGGLFLQIGEEDVRHTALSFDMSASYGQSALPLTPAFDAEKGKWGYTDGEGEFVLEAKYDEAYGFAANGYAAVVEDGSLKFINRYGTTLIDAYAETVYDQRYAVTGYYPPVTGGIESLGMFYFDRGLVRVRKYVLDRWAGKALEDRDLLIYENGETFPLPAGYTLKAYSDGAALLEKDGKFGFLDHTGYWIAQPVYDRALPFSEGLAPLTVNGKSGMIDAEGNVILPFIYDHVSACSGGLVLTFSEEGGWQIFRKSAAPS